jgi:hypothetical protein
VNKQIVALVAFLAVTFTAAGMNTEPMAARMMFHGGITAK